MTWFEGKKVFLVGGTAGIGRAAALQLARQGASVVVAARRQGPLDQVLAALREAAVADTQRFGAVALDVTDRDGVAGIASKVLELLGGLDVLVCNTGRAQLGYVHDLDDAAFDEMLDLNFRGHVRVVRAFLPHFREQRSGDICLVSSMLGFMSVPGYSAYSASKFAIAGFADSLRQELLLDDVRVTPFYPPTTKTPGLEAENADKPDAVWAMESDSGWNKIYTADEVGAALLKAIKRGRFENVVGFDSWLIWWIYGRFPRLARWLADMEWKKAVEKVASGEFKRDDPAKSDPAAA